MVFSFFRGGKKLGPGENKEQMEGKKSLKLAHLDGCRAIGIVEVIYYHMGFTVCRHAWLCISLFFALSGMLITGITVDTFAKHRTMDIVRFWSRRVGRLLPALLMLITIIAIVSYFFDNPDDGDQHFLRGDLLFGIFYLENMHLIAKQEDYFAGWQKPSIVRHVWTLAIEEQYYLVWPILFWLWTRAFMDWKGTEDDRDALLSHAEDATGEGEDDPGMEAIDNDLEDVQIVDPEEEGEFATPDRRETARESEMELLERPEPTQDVQRGQRPEDDDPRFTTCLYALCVGECLVILLSYLSSFLTINEMGMSAAYFSTWSRCGDFACGGLVYLLVHLNPKIRKRYKHEEGLEPMTFKFRVWCEVGLLCTVLLMTVPPMIQFKLDDMLNFYFYYFRVPFSFSVICFTVPGALQTSEPLPSWAIVSRFLNHPTLAMLGVVSYSVYLFHWPLILWLGDPVNHSAFEQKEAGTYDGEEYTSLQLLRDHGIAVLSIFLGVLSFFCYEKPLMIQAAKVKKSWKVLVVGLFSSFLVAGIVLLCTPDAKDPTGEAEADYKKSWERVYATHELEHNPAPVGWNPTGGFGAPMYGIDGRQIVDHRYTPIGFLTPTYSRLSIASILDVYTMPKDLPDTYLNYERENIYGDGWPQETHPNDIYTEMSKRAGPNTVLFVCRTIALLQPEQPYHPCWNHHWAPNVTWIWVSSHLLCSEIAESNHHISEEGFEGFFVETECSDLDIRHISFPDEQKWTYQDTWSYSGRQDRDAYLLQEMILAGVDENPEAFNRQSIAEIRANHAEGRVLIEYLGKYVQDDGTFTLPEIDQSTGVMKQMIVGESVAYKIGQYATELVQKAEECTTNLNELGMELQPFPILDIINLGLGVQDTIGHFIPCAADCQANPFMRECVGTKIDCSLLIQHAADRREFIRDAIPRLRASLLVIVDGHFRDKGRMVPEPSTETWELALEAMLRSAQNSGTKHAVIFTSSPMDMKYQNIFEVIESYNSVVKRRKCRNSIGGLEFTLFEWHKLICPEFETLDFDNQEKCAWAQHGFHKILGDQVHPKGAAGAWLVSNSWRGFMGMYADMELGYAAEQIQNVGFIRCMNESYPPDYTPPIHSIITTERICL